MGASGASGTSDITTYVPICDNGGDQREFTGMLLPFQVV